jgi:hypothetical protein
LFPATTGIPTVGKSFGDRDDLVFHCGNIPRQSHKHWACASIIISGLLELSSDILADRLIVPVTTHSQAIMFGV